ncbi:hypothetical protein THER_0008 [Thermodesulfovibrio sp. N1]|nr:hypothetical protein THER_0008 [Thermodesulfovibrio sp. N1]
MSVLIKKGARRKMNLLYFEKPTRYINSEINSIIKKKKIT